MSERPRQRYIVGPIYDWVFFLLPPLAALAIGAAISGTAFADAEFEFLGQEATGAGLLIGTIIHAHIFLVFFRSHGNREIFETYPLRFVLAPVLLYAAMVWSSWVLISIAVLTTFWDVYHSGMQTFGFGRIYDQRAGNSPHHARELDWWLNHLLYAGPILAGATMMAHFESFESFEDVGATFFTAIPALMEGHQRYLSWALLGGGTGFLVYYVYAHWQFHRQGHPVASAKLFLYATTGLCSIYTWGFNTWGEAFFIMNLFHAVQYFGLVCAMEKRNLVRIFRVSGRRFATPLSLLGLFLVTGAYGYWVEVLDTDVQWLWAITLVASIMHFWYDGFVWSVSRRQV